MGTLKSLKIKTSRVRGVRWDSPGYNLSKNIEKQDFGILLQPWKFE